MASFEQKLEYNGLSEFRLDHSNGIYFPQFFVNGILYQEGRDYAINSLDGKLYWVGDFDLDALDDLRVVYSHACDKYCWSNKQIEDLSPKPETHTKVEIPEVKEESKIGVKMFWRALFYTILAVVLLNSAYVPLWTIFFPLVADVLYCSVTRMFSKKKKKDYLKKYKGIIRVPHNRSKKKIKTWAKELKSMGFEVLDWDRKGLEFQGSRKTYQKHINSELLSLAYVPERETLIKRDFPEVSTDDVVQVDDSGRVAKAVETLRKIRFDGAHKGVKYEEYKAKPEPAKILWEGVNKELDYAAQDEAATKSYVDSLYSDYNDEDTEVVELNDPVVVKAKAKKATTVDDLMLGQKGFITPWNIRVSEVDGRMFVKSDAPVEEDALGTFCAKVTRKIGGVDLDLSNIYAGHTWDREKNLKDLTPGFYKVRNIVV